MNSEQFTYWLKGFFELSESNTLNEKQVQIIKDHLDLVFNKVTPDRKKITLDDYVKQCYVEREQENTHQRLNEVTCSTTANQPATLRGELKYY